MFSKKNCLITFLTLASLFTGDALLSTPSIAQSTNDQHVFCNGYNREIMLKRQERDYYGRTYFTSTLAKMRPYYGYKSGSSSSEIIATGNCILLNNTNARFGVFIADRNGYFSSQPYHHSMSLKQSYDGYSRTYFYTCSSIGCSYAGTGY